MAQKTLTTSYLARLSNANHDGVTQQIDDRFAAFETDNTMFINAATAVHAARQAEDIAFKRFSGKDFASDDLKREDRLEDQYMSTIRAMLNALTLLPETEQLRPQGRGGRAGVQGLPVPDQRRLRGRGPQDSEHGAGVADA